MLCTNPHDYGSIIPDWYVPDATTIKSLSLEVPRLWKLEADAIMARNSGQAEYYRKLGNIFIKAHDEALSAYLRELDRVLVRSQRLGKRLA